MCDPLDDGQYVMVRAWVAKARYPGLLPFKFGTVYADTAVEALTKLRRAHETHFPVPLPDDCQAIPGAIGFMEAPADHVGKRNG